MQCAPHLLPHRPQHSSPQFLQQSASIMMALRSWGPSSLFSPMSTCSIHAAILQSPFAASFLSPQHFRQLHPPPSSPTASLFIALFIYRQLRLGPDDHDKPAFLGTPEHDMSEDTDSLKTGKTFLSSFLEPPRMFKGWKCQRDRNLLTFNRRLLQNLSWKSCYTQ